MTSPWKRIVYGEVEVTLLSRNGSSVDDVLAELHRRGVVIARLHGHAQQCSFVIGISDFSLLYTACRSRRVKIRFGQRHGLPFIAKRAWRRKSFFVGLAVFGITLHMLGSVIWSVSVSGVQGDTASQVVAAARDAGIRVGARRTALGDVKGLQDSILKSMPNLLWVGVNLNGGVAHIEAIEKVSGVKAANLPPQNIVAVKTGVIRRVFATRGEIKVRPGQVVLPHQVIISGSLADGAVHVAAQGRAIAEVWYTSHVQVPLKTTASELSGEYVTRHYLVLGPLHLRVWGFQQPNYAHQINQTNEQEWRIGPWKVPIGWETSRLYEVGSKMYAKSESQAQATALALVLQDVRAQAGRESEVISERILQQQVTHGKLYETVLTRMEEDIGLAVPIPPSELSNRPADGSGST